MISYSDFYENAYMCDRLIQLLEQDMQDISLCLQGDILEEYKDYINLEIRKMQEIKKKLLNAMV